MVQFGQLVVGPPGAGKSTYCAGLQRFYRSQGRPVAVVNLDPANTSPPYEVAVDVAELVQLEEVMDELQLGPNGALIYYIDHLRENVDWLHNKLRPLEGHYLLFDLPGQVELFMMHDALKEVIATMVKQWDLRLTAVHLVDSHLCSDPNKYLSALLLSLSTMLHLELPHINVLSKMDLLERYGELAFNLDYYMDVQDLSYLVQHMERSNPRMSKRYSKLTAGLCELVEDFSLVSFAGLNIEDRESVATLVATIDKSNGYVFQGLRQKHEADGEPEPPEMVYTATRTQTEDERVMRLQDKYVGTSGGEQHAGGQHAGETMETATAPETACAECGGGSSASGGALQRCSRCHSVKYCSVACQRRHWQIHKALCAGGASGRETASGDGRT